MMTCSGPQFHTYEHRFGTYRLWVVSICECLKLLLEEEGLIYARRAPRLPRCARFSDSGFCCYGAACPPRGKRARLIAAWPSDAVAEPKRGSGDQKVGPCEGVTGSSIHRQFRRRSQVSMPQTDAADFCLSKKYHPSRLRPLSERFRCHASPSHAASMTEKRGRNVWSTLLASVYCQHAESLNPFRKA